MSLGSALKEIRKSKGLSQDDVADSVGITQTYVSMLETDKAFPSKKTLMNIAKTLGLPHQIIELYSLEDNDFAEDKRPTFRVVFPMIKDLLKPLIANNDEN